MSTANEIQHGGDHYKKREYQHWDFVTDIKMQYLPACASKYASRWKDKGGLLDLDKAIHYTEKAAERDIVPVKKIKGKTSLISAFCQQLPPAEHDIVWALVMGDWELAKTLLCKLRNANSDGNEMNCG